MATSIPDEERFEVYEQYRDGRLARHPCVTSHWQDSAQRAAEELTAEAAQRHAIESKGPIKPDPPRTYVVVKVTETRGVLG